MRPWRIWLSIAVCTLFFAMTSAAKLGETEAVAKSRAPQWKQEFDASLPLLVTKNGKVVQECWEGPGKGWSEKEALQFALSLLPDEVDGAAPKRVQLEDSNHAFQVTAKYRIYFKSLQGVVYSLEVADASAFDDYRC